MAPLVHKHTVESLPERINIVNKNFQDEKRRKGPAIDLKECPLFEMTQYSCNPPDEGVPTPGVVTCKPLVKLFRRYVFGISNPGRRGRLMLMAVQVRWGFDG